MFIHYYYKIPVKNIILCENVMNIDEIKYTHVYQELLFRNIFQATTARALFFMTHTHTHKFLNKTKVEKATTTTHSTNILLQNISLNE